MEITDILNKLREFEQPVAELDDKQRTASSLKYSSDPRVAYFDKMMKRYGPKLMELIIDHSHIISTDEKKGEEKLKKYGQTETDFMNRFNHLDGVEEDLTYMLMTAVEKGEEGLIDFFYDRVEQAKKAGDFSKTSRIPDPDEYDEIGVANKHDESFTKVERTNPVTEATITPQQIEAFKQWHEKYSKMKTKDVYNYAEGIFKAHMETGDTELDGYSRQDPEGKAYDELNAIFPEMKAEVEEIGNALRAKGIDPFSGEKFSEGTQTEGAVKAMLMDIEQDAVELSKEEFIKKHNGQHMDIWNRVQKEKEEVGESKMKKESVNESITISTDSPQEASMMMQILKLAGVKPVDQDMINQPEKNSCGCETKFNSHQKEHNPI